MGKVKPIIITAAMAVVSAFSAPSLAQSSLFELDMERLEHHMINCLNTKLENNSPGLDAGIKACEMVVAGVASYVDIGYLGKPQDAGLNPKAKQSLIDVAGGAAMMVATLELAKLGGSTNPEMCLSTGKAMRIFEHLPAAESGSRKQSPSMNALVNRCSAKGLPLY